MVKKRTFVLQFIFGIAILALIVWYFGAENYFKVLSSTNIFWLLIACIPFALVQLNISYQFYRLYRKSGFKLTFIDSLMITCWGSFIGMINQAALILFKIEALHKASGEDRLTCVNRFGFLHSVGSLLTVIGAFLGLWTIGSFIDPSVAVYLQAFALILLTCAVGFILLIVPSTPLLGFKNAVLKRLPSFLRNALGKVVSSDIPTSKFEAAVIFGLSIVTWILKSFEWTLIFHAINPEDFAFSPQLFFFCFSIFFLLDIARQMPFIPTNIGIYDLVIAAGFSATGVAGGPIGLVFAMLTRFTCVVGSGWAFIQPHYILKVLSGTTPKSPS
ncbi:MAG: lysylphosphatidylglycerol synthase domain-containing protein [Candidatus Bathyarchaeia archaeon]